MSRIRGLAAAALFVGLFVVAGCQDNHSLSGTGPSAPGASPGNPVAAPPSASPTPARPAVIDQSSGTGDRDQTFSSTDPWTLDWRSECAAGAAAAFSIAVDGGGAKESGSAAAQQGHGQLKGSGAIGPFHITIRTGCQWQITVRG